MQVYRTEKIRNVAILGHGGAGKTTLVEGMAYLSGITSRLGNVNENTYQEMFNGKHLHDILYSACNECLPECSYCVFQPYCGADPVRNLSEQGDMVGFRPTNEMCKKNKAIFQYLFELLKKNDPEINRIFWSWINPR